MLEFINTNNKLLLLSSVLLGILDSVISTSVIDLRMRFDSIAGSVSTLTAPVTTFAMTTASESLLISDL